MRASIGEILLAKAHGGDIYAYAAYEILSLRRLAALAEPVVESFRRLGEAARASAASIEDLGRAFAKVAKAK